MKETTTTKFKETTKQQETKLRNKHKKSLRQTKSHCVISMLSGWVETLFISGLSRHANIIGSGNLFGPKDHLKRYTANKL